MRGLLVISILAALVSLSNAYDQLLLRPSPFTRRLIKTAEHEPATWMSQAEIDGLIRSKIKFMDITDTRQLLANELAQSGTIKMPEKIALPKVLKNDEQIRQIVDTLDKDQMTKNLKKFSSFHTRYYRSESGKKSQEWLLDYVKSIAAASELNITVSEVKHEWKQRSIIARFEGRGTKAEKEQVVVLGAHQDSVNMWLPSFGRSPGADDDGSGTCTTLEAFRALVASEFKPKRSVEFHWYSAEEAGLLGSQAVAQSYRQQGTKVLAMLQSDMTGYPDEEKSYGIVRDHVDPKLSDFLTELANKYSGLKTKDMRCGYACSDHASWNQANYSSAFHFEASRLNANPYVHTADDDVKTIDFDHMLSYSKVVVAFAVELGNNV